MRRQLIVREWQCLCVALGLLSRIPVPHPGNTEGSIQGGSLHWFPAVGLLIGLILLTIEELSPAVPLLTASLLLAVWVLLTGVLHLDGLADCCDAWVGGFGDRERTLRIMKDPACGPAGVTAIVVVLLLKSVALSTLIEASGSGWWLIPMLARAALPIAFFTTPYVRPGGMGDQFQKNASRIGMVSSVVIVSLVSAMLTPSLIWWSWLLVIVLVIVQWRGSMVRRLGGFTGDGAGALVELLETVLLVVAAILVDVS